MSTLSDDIKTMQRLIDHFEALREDITTKDPCSLRRVPDAVERTNINCNASDIIDLLQECVDYAEQIQESFAEIQTRRRVS